MEQHPSFSVGDSFYIKDFIFVFALDVIHSQILVHPLSFYLTVLVFSCHLH